ncbi:TIGR03747 family integrating conjugative element membrane protein [Aquisalimonas lutea]|uniref:TIGR03747 family integrating conjugative element membrane protein n=1 Tax=Aquisalimonas lutea TaxID=1327750 RepID=UPI0025B56E83|nr:TIGR03747 family integrating conjugative element membrane protein [Aquisalimonas lutea]MDN3519058.1 TIGR03747 family integrating conjugative element membrane protein [Aquisalimonas lutea]
MATQQTVRQQARQPTGVVGRTCAYLGQTIVWLLLALVFSIVVEWIGQTWIWPDQGVEHSRQMLQRELGYLHQDFERSVVPGIDNSAMYAKAFADWTYYGVVEASGLQSLLRWLARSPDPEGGDLQHAARASYAAAEPYILSAVTIMQVFALRVGVLTLAMPIFVLFGLVAVVDGLVQRELRRWGGGRESSFVYHHAKRLMMPSIAMAWVVYLALPVSTHPNWVILPFSVLNATTVAITASRFKKYL